VVAAVGEVYGLRHSTTFEVVLTSLHTEKPAQLRLDPRDVRIFE